MTNQMKTQARPFYVDDDLSVSYLAGQGNRLVVAFAGIGLGMGSIQQEEFAGTASDGETNHVAFVTDRNRSWYSLPGIQDRILQSVEALIAEKGITSVVCLGNSMGGHGALLFARRLGAATAIAFVPQYSMDPAVIDERRWPQFRANIRTEGLRDLGQEMTSKTVCHTFYGADDSGDVPHSRLMIAHGVPNVYFVRGSDHDAARILKQNRLLTPAITAMIQGDQAAMVAVLKDHLAEIHLSEAARAHVAL